MKFWNWSFKLIWHNMNIVQFFQKSLLSNVHNVPYTNSEKRKKENNVLWNRKESKYIFFLYIFLASGGGFPLYYTMILQRPRIIVGDSGFEPETSAPEVWGATNEPPENMHIKPNMTTCKINNCIYYRSYKIVQYQYYSYILYNE